MDKKKNANITTQVRTRLLARHIRGREQFLAVDVLFVRSMEGEPFTLITISLAHVPAVLSNVEHAFHNLFIQTPVIEEGRQE
jgi:hypothetical protein